VRVCGRGSGTASTRDHRREHFRCLTTSRIPSPGGTTVASPGRKPWERVRPRFHPSPVGATEVRARSLPPLRGLGTGSRFIPRAPALGYTRPPRWGSPFICRQHGHTRRFGIAEFLPITTPPGGVLRLVEIQDERLHE
jgi:hypothetical protein